MPLFIFLPQIEGSLRLFRNFVLTEEIHFDEVSLAWPSNGSPGGSVLALEAVVGSLGGLGLT